MSIEGWFLRRSGRFYLVWAAGLLYAILQLRSAPIELGQFQVNKLQQQASSTSSRHESISTSKPNILLFLLDQWRYDWDGFHTSPTGEIPLNLPFFTSMTSKGTRFTQAYVPSPICGPSRACFASGKEFDEIGMSRNHADDLPTNTTTFYKLMRDSAGYHTMSCGKDDLFKGDINFPYFPGVDYSKRDGWMDLGFSDAIRTTGKTKVVRIQEPYDPYRTYLENTIVSLPDGKQIHAIDAYRDCWDGKIAPGSSNCESSSFTEELHPDTYTQRKAMELLDRKPLGKPWFLQINFPGPHPPYLSTKEMSESVAGREWPIPYDTEQYDTICPQQEILRDGKEFGPQRDGRCNYGAQIEHIDYLMDQTIRHLDSMKELDNTLVCITADHGEMLGDHGIIAKSKPWQGAISVPLLCFGPGVKKGYVYENPVTTLDLPGTFLDYTGYGSAPHPMTTRSLRPLLQDATVDAIGWESSKKSVDNLGVTRESVSSGYGNWRAVIKATSLKLKDKSVQRASSYKLICCKGACPKSSNDGSLISDEGWNLLLYDTIADPFDMIPLQEEFPSIVEEMAPLLPRGWCV